MQSRANNLTAITTRAGRTRSWPVVALLAALAWSQAWSNAADPSAAPPATPVREVGPELFYVERDDGRLVPVPGFQYRDFVDLLRVRDGIAGPLEPPAAVLDQVVVRIDARGIEPAAEESSPEN